ncbi:hypothetical protein ACH41E_18180 [Streptomyces sp. NPDC020412]|uniref:hypothetical protein n=1 Tax=Streptomyces sp. NPDC020412 TaxID=3365073 RepID=UPI0037932F50
MTGDEFARIVQHCKDQMMPALQDDTTVGQKQKEEIDEDIDALDLLRRAVRLDAGRATSILPRKAKRLMDLMESQGIVGPIEGTKAHKVVLKAGELGTALAAIQGEVTTR